MKFYQSKRRLIYFAFFATALLVSCQKDLLDRAENQPLVEGGSIVDRAAPSPQARALAANCFQCHGTNGHAGELKIASMSAASMINKFNTYKQKAPNADIMYLHAQSYTTAEIALIADFFSQQ